MSGLGLFLPVFCWRTLVDKAKRCKLTFKGYAKLYS